METVRFIYRGLTILEYEPERKALRIREVAADCKFIPEDMPLMAQFIMDCNAHQLGTGDVPEEVRVD